MDIQNLIWCIIHAYIFYQKILMKALSCTYLPKCGECFSRKALKKIKEICLVSIKILQIIYIYIQKY